MARPEFHYHTVTHQISERMAIVREHFINLSEILDEALPPGRSASLAQTYLEESCMRAIQSLSLLGEKIEKGVVV